ncbi:MAG: STAS domain-containing protein [Phycisphaerales bacterium]|nr:MAG: STAS domain-containing protein [Phycisphaerales bacterium]
MEEIVGLENSRDGGFAIASFKSACISDVEKITCASKKIKEFVEQNRPNRLIFDFATVKFFSSQVLGLLLDVRAKVKAFDGEVVISAINPQLHRVFKITNLDKIFRFFPDRQSAAGATAAS